MARKRRRERGLTLLQDNVCRLATMCLSLSGSYGPGLELFRSGGGAAARYGRKCWALASMTQYCAGEAQLQIWSSLRTQWTASGSNVVFRASERSQNAWALDGGRQLRVGRVEEADCHRSPPRQIMARTQPHLMLTLRPAALIVKRVPLPMSSSTCQSTPRPRRPADRILETSVKSRTHSEFPDIKHHRGIMSLLT